MNPHPHRPIPRSRPRPYPETHAKVIEAVALHLAGGHPSERLMDQDYYDLAQPLRFKANLDALGISLGIIGQVVTSFAQELGHDPGDLWAELARQLLAQVPVDNDRRQG